jgi:pyrroloquinoline quinone biosynthesis protein E
VPCCYVGNPDVLQIGEPIEGERTFAAIWHGEPFAAFRRRHLAGDLPAVCRRCYAPAAGEDAPASSAR